MTRVEGENTRPVALPSKTTSLLPISHLSLSQSRNLKRLLDKGYEVLPLLSLSGDLNKLNSLLHKRFCDFSFPSLTEEGYASPNL
jgi:hypothetical protein